MPRLDHKLLTFSMACLLSCCSAACDQPPADSVASTDAGTDTGTDTGADAGDDECLDECEVCDNDDDTCCPATSCHGALWDSDFYCQPQGYEDAALCAEVSIPDEEGEPCEHPGLICFWDGIPDYGWCLCQGWQLTYE